MNFALVSKLSPGISLDYDLAHVHDSFADIVVIVHEAARLDMIVHGIYIKMSVWYIHNFTLPLVNLCQSSGPNLT